MSRPLRIEFAGAVYHVTARGDRREPIFVDAADRRQLLDVVALGAERFDASAFAYCLMGNHYHFVLHTRRANLSRLMRHVNGVYTQAFNRRHRKVGHLFQGRFTAILVDRDAYLAAVCRYVELNPVRAKLVDRPADWPWSSYRAHALLESGPNWLDTNGLHAFVLQREIKSARDRRSAAKRYVELVEARRDDRLWPSALRQQIYLGDERFVARMQERMSPQRATDAAVPRQQRRPPTPLSEWLARPGPREKVVADAYRDGGFTLRAIAADLGVSISQVSKLIRRAEAVDGGLEKMET